MQFWLISYYVILPDHSQKNFRSLYVLQFRQAKSDIVNASKAVYNKLTTGLGQNNQGKAETRTTNQKQSSLWFKAMVSAGRSPLYIRTKNFSQEADDGPK
jgi:hypothetical protein